MVFRKLFGRGDEEPKHEGGVTIRVEIGRKTFVQWYEDLEIAQIRFPQYLADLSALHDKRDTGERD